MPSLVQFAVRTVGVEHFAKHLGTRAVAQELAGREQIDPFVHAVHLVAAVIVGQLTDNFDRRDVERFPLGKLLGQHRLNLGAVVVLGPGRSVATNPFLAGPAGPGLDEHSFLVDDGEKLLPHSTGLRLSLDLVAVDDSLAVRVGAGTVAPSNSPGRLLSRCMDDLK